MVVYGCYGYTGSLVVAEAVSRGHRPVLAGRDEARVRDTAESSGLPWKAVALDDADGLDALLDGEDLVIHCAGPFVHTAQPMAEACLRTRTHYLDITGEIAVFEWMAAADAKARDAGIVLMPGTGFDVVPSDSLAAYLARRLPGARALVLAIRGGGRLSRGTATTMAENAGAGGAVRRDGKIVKVPAGWKTRMIDFGNGPALTVTIPWGDVSTAWHTTGIPDVEVYAAATPGMVRDLKLIRWLAPLFRLGLVKYLMKTMIRRGPAGPSPESRDRTISQVWGEATDTAGERVAARIDGPNGYTLTAQTAVRIAERVMSDSPPPGFHTPAGALGPDFILDIPGIRRTVVD